MELRRISLFIGLFVLLAATQSSESRSHSVSPRDANPDVNYDQVLSDAAAEDDTQNDADGGEEEDEEVQAVILNKGEDFKVLVGRTVRLPCQIKPSPKENDLVAFQWFKDGEPLFLNTNRLGANARMTIDHDTRTDLIIAEISPSDSGVYKCDVFQPTGIEHTVRVEAPAVIRGMIATSNGLVVEGTDVTITCNVTGTPPPKLIWSKEGRNGENHGLSQNDGIFSGNSVFMKSIKQEQGGKYLCYADNKVADPVVGAISIKVLGKPRVHVHKTIINSAANVEAIMRCSAHEEPPAEIRWYKDGQRIETSAKWNINTVGQHSNLTVTPVGDEDFGTFTCVAENQYGAHNKSIQLVQSPVVEDIDVDGPKLSLKVHSHQPLEQIELQLRELSGEGSSRTISIPLPSQKNHAYEIIYNLEDKQLEPGRYEALINVKNEYSWSDHTGPAVIEIETQPQSIQGASVYRGGATVVRSETVLLSTIFTYLLIRMF